MTDKQFQLAINKCFRLKTEYFEALRKCEEEYERRHGANPSDIDDDQWIDRMHYPGGAPPSVEQVKIDFELHS